VASVVHTKTSVPWISPVSTWLFKKTWNLQANGWTNLLHTWLAVSSELGTLICWLVRGIKPIVNMTDKARSDIANNMAIRDYIWRDCWLKHRGDEVQLFIYIFCVSYYICLYIWSSSQIVSSVNWTLIYLNFPTYNSLNGAQFSKIIVGKDYVSS
jgi:hypothetical protein